MAPARTSKRVKTSPSMDQKRAVRIAGCSGGFLDRANAITRMAGDPGVDVVMGMSTFAFKITETDSGRRLVVRNDHDSTWKRQS